MYFYRPEIPAHMHMQRVPGSFSLPRERAWVRGYRDSSAGWAESHIKPTQHKAKHLSLKIRQTQTLYMYIHVHVHVQMVKKSTTPRCNNTVHMCAYMYVQYAIESFSVTREYRRGSQKSGTLRSWKRKAARYLTFHMNLSLRKTIGCHGKPSINFECTHTHYV